MTKTKDETVAKYDGEKSITVGVSLIAVDCLKALLRTGLYGATLEDVCQRIIEERLRGMVEMKR